MRLLTADATMASRVAARAMLRSSQTATNRRSVTGSRVRRIVRWGWQAVPIVACRIGTPMVPKYRWRRRSECLECRHDAPHRFDRLAGHRARGRPARRPADPAAHAADRTQAAMAARCVRRRPARDRGRLVRAAQADAAAGRHRRAGGARPHAARAHGVGAGAQPEGRRASHRIGRARDAAAAVGQPRAQPGEPEAHTRRGGRGHCAASSTCATPSGSNCQVEIGISTAFGCTIQGRVEPAEVLRLLRAAHRRRRRPRRPGRHRGVCRSAAGEDSVRAGP